jgi:prepilin-type N-terminal cleavage/methylation domain-containing protein
MRAPHAYRGFTLIELIATITILAIVAAIALPREIAANSFAERGYADELAAQLRRARVVALTTGCDVQFSVNGQGYALMQRGAGANNHCVTAGAWTTTVASGVQPAKVQLGAPRVVVFGTAGTAGAAVTINLGTRQITVANTGLVTGP